LLIIPIFHFNRIKLSSRQIY